MPRASTVRDLLKRLTRDAPGTSRRIKKARREAMREEGIGSLFAWPALAYARKIKGKENVRRTLYSKYHRPLKNVDEKAGRVLERELGTKKLFRQVDVLPAGRTMRGKHKVRIEHETHSATAPVTKAVKAVTPLAATLYLANLLYKKGEATMADQTDSAPIEDKDNLLKEAAVALNEAQRRDEAVKLAFSMIERGSIPSFATYDEFIEKVGSLLEKDLRVVAEALEMNINTPEFGKVASVGGTHDSPEAAFMHRLADD
jgi:hypothetical protein